MSKTNSNTVIEEAPALPPVESVAQNVIDAAQALAQSDEENPVNEPVKRKRGRPKGSKNRAEKTAESPIPDYAVLAEQLTPAFTATGAMACEMLAIEAPFTEMQGKVLADAWAPVLAMYMHESTNPWIGAILTTALVAMPYSVVYVKNKRAKKEQ